MAAFEINMLGRKDAETEYSPIAVENGLRWIAATGDEEKNNLLLSIMAGLPGKFTRYDVAGLKSAISLYKGIDQATLRQNYGRFLEEVLPIAERYGIKMCVHPDDPPRDILGLPRIVSSEEDIDWVLNHHSSKSNGLTLCSGSLGAGLSNDVVKIAKFCLQIAKIPPSIISSIQKNIDYNNGLSKKISQLEKDLDDGTKKDQEKEKKISEDRIDESMKVLKKEINRLRSLIKSIELTECYIPNKKDHSMKWDYEYTGDVFTSDIQSETVEKILLLDDVDDIWKILLLMGIGVFANHENKNYVEIMKLLSQEQKLFMIIASTDYIYGTNYQFCHGYIGKDLGGLTQEKTIQALGRIGRSKIQQKYTLRFRDDDLVKKVFISQDYKPEVNNINKLLIS